MNRENENLSESGPELSAVEAALAQLRPRREARFADEVKSQIKDALSDKTASPENAEKATTTVKVPLTYYIRIARFNAAVGGLLVGLLLGVVLGGSGVFWALERLEPRPSRPVPLSDAGRLPYARMLLENRASLTPQERALFEELDKEPNHVQR